MTLKNDRLLGRGIGMTELEARPNPDEGRREPNLRIVYSNDAPGASAIEGQPASRRQPLIVNRDAMLDRTLQARIGGLLREVFGDTADAPVPDRFVKLLEALEKKEAFRE